MNALSEDTTFETFRIEYDKLARALSRSLDTEKKLLKHVSNIPTSRLDMSGHPQNTKETHLLL